MVLPLATASWLLGLLGGGLLPAGPARPWIAWVTLALAGWVGSRALAGTTQRWPRAGLCSLALLAGVASAPHGRTPSSGAASLRAGLAVVEGRVLRVRHRSGDARSTVLSTAGHYLDDRSPVPAGRMLSVAPFALPADAHVRLLTTLQPITPYRNPSPHPPWPSATPIDAVARLASEGAVEVVHQAALSRLLDGARAHVRAQLGAHLTERHAGLARALVLGEGGAVHEDDRDAIRRAGLAHVLAVSGLHVAIVAGMLVVLLRRLLLRLSRVAPRLEARRIACGIGVPLALLIALFAGGSPSALRAGTTAALAWTVLAAGRNPAPSAVAAGAVWLITALDPSLALRPGMLLSVAATAAILSTHGTGPGAASALKQLVTMSSRTLLATAPLVLWCFGSVALPGLVSNVVLLPVASALLIPVAALHAAGASASPVIASLTAPAFTGCADAFVGGCALLSRLDPGQWPPPDVAQAVVLSGWTVAVLALRSLRGRLLASALALIAIGVAEYRLVQREQPRGQLRVTFLDVGQGDAALVDLPDGRLMLIDAGGALGRGPDPGERVLQPLLRARRHRRIDIAVLSHPHPDHYGGLEALLRDVPIGELWDSGQAEPEAELSPTAAAATRLLQTARLGGTRVRSPADLCGHPTRAGGATIGVLWPCPGYDSGLDANDNSLVVRVDFGRRRLLFAGDIEGEAERSLVVSDAALRADVLKVAHHGSRTSSSAAFLARVGPRLAVVSAGAHNRFGHPHAPVMDRLRRAGAHVVEIARTGGAVLMTDGDGLRLETWSGHRWRD